YRDALGMEQLADWSSEAGRVVALDAGRAVLELLDQAQAGVVDEVEAGRRVSGTVRFALRVADSDAMARRLTQARAAAGAPRGPPRRGVTARPASRRPTGCS